VLKMFVSANSLNRLGEIIHSSGKKPPQELLAVIQQHYVNSVKESARDVCIWHIVLITTVMTGVCASCILLKAFVLGLLSGN